MLALGAAAAATFRTTPLYTASTQLFVSAQSDAGVNSAYTGALFTQQRVKSYTEIISSPQVAQLVVNDLALQESPEAIAGQITATAPLDTVLLDVSVSDPDPHRAQRIASSLGRVFPRFVESIERPPTGGGSPVKVSVVKGAELPTAPTSPRVRLNLAIGLLLGLAAGTGASVLRDALDTRVRTAEQAEAAVGAPVLGAIAFDRSSASRPLIVHLAPRSPRAEAFRHVRTNLTFVDVDRPAGSLVITSALLEEGKSTASCNLAISLAQAGESVILVEADLRRPRVADYLGVERAVGLTSVLTGQVSLDDALQPWGDGRLQVLPSGPIPPNPSELLGSNGMSRLLENLQRLGQHVIIDAPPLLPVTDAAVLGAKVDGVILIVRSGHTSRDQLARATETLRSVGARVLGSVLNMVPTGGPDAYHYGYGYYGKSDPEAASDAPSQTPAPIAVAPRVTERVAPDYAPGAEQAGWVTERTDV